MLKENLKKTAHSFKEAAREAREYATALMRLRKAKSETARKTQTNIKTEIQRRGGVYGGPR